MGEPIKKQNAPIKLNLQLGSTGSLSNLSSLSEQSYQQAFDETHEPVNFAPEYFESDSQYDVGLGRETLESSHDFQKNRAEQQSTYDQIGGMLNQAIIGEVVGGTIMQAGALFSPLIGSVNKDGEEFHNFIYDIGNNIYKWTQETTPIYRDPDKRFSDPAYYLQSGVSVMSFASSFIPGIGVAKGFQFLNKLMQLSKLGTAGLIAGDFIAQLGGAGAMRHAEAFRESSGTYDDNVKAGEAFIDSKTQEKLAKVQGMLQPTMDSELKNLPPITVGVESPYYKEQVINRQLSEQNIRNKYNSILETESQKIYADSAKEHENMKKAAADAAAMQYTANYANLVFDFIQLGAIMKPLRGLTRNLRITGEMAKAQELATGVIKPISKVGKTVRSIRDFEVLEKMSEGAEEVVNTTNQKEATRQFNIETGIEQEDGSSFGERVINSFADEDIQDSFIWGVIGGVVGNKLGNALNNATGGSSQMKTKLAEISKRKENLTKYIDALKTAEESGNDTKAEHIKTQMSYNIARSSVQAGNADLLLEQIESPSFAKELKDSGLADDQVALKIKDLKETVLFVEDQYKKMYTNLRDDPRAFDYLFTQKINERHFGKLKQDATNKINEIQSKITSNNFIDGVPLDVQSLMSQYAEHQATISAIEESIKRLQEIDGDNRSYFDEKTGHYKSVSKNKVGKREIEYNQSVYEIDKSLPELVKKKNELTKNLEETLKLYNEQNKTNYTHDNFVEKLAEKWNVVNSLTKELIDQKSILRQSIEHEKTSADNYNKFNEDESFRNERLKEYDEEAKNQDKERLTKKETKFQEKISSLTDEELENYDTSKLGEKQTKIISDLIAKRKLEKAKANVEANKNKPEPKPQADRYSYNPSERYNIITDEEENVRIYDGDKPVAVADSFNEAKVILDKLRLEEKNKLKEDTKVVESLNPTEIDKEPELSKDDLEEISDDIFEANNFDAINDDRMTPSHRAGFFVTLGFLDSKYEIDGDGKVNDLRDDEGNIIPEQTKDRSHLIDGKLSAGNKIKLFVVDKKDKPENSVIGIQLDSEFDGKNPMFFLHEKAWYYEADGKTLKEGVQQGTVDEVMRIRNMMFNSQDTVLSTTILNSTPGFLNITKSTDGKRVRNSLNKTFGKSKAVIATVNGQRKVSFADGVERTIINRNFKNMKTGVAFMAVPTADKRYLMTPIFTHFLNQSSQYDRMLDILSKLIYIHIKDKSSAKNLGIETMTQLQDEISKHVYRINNANVEKDAYKLNPRTLFNIYEHDGHIILQLFDGDVPKNIFLNNVKDVNFIKGKIKGAFDKGKHPAINKNHAKDLNAPFTFIDIDKDGNLKQRSDINYLQFLDEFEYASTNIQAITDEKGNKTFVSQPVISIDTKNINNERNIPEVKVSEPVKSDLESKKADIEAAYNYITTRKYSGNRRDDVNKIGEDMAKRFVITIKEKGLIKESYRMAPRTDGSVEKMKVNTDFEGNNLGNDWSTAGKFKEEFRKFVDVELAVLEKETINTKEKEVKNEENVVVTKQEDIFAETKSKSELISEFGKDVLNNKMLGTSSTDDELYELFGKQRERDFEEYIEYSPAFESEEEYNNYIIDFNKRKEAYNKYKQNNKSVYVAETKPTQELNKNKQKIFGAQRNSGKNSNSANLLDYKYFQEGKLSDFSNSFGLKKQTEIANTLRDVILKGLEEHRKNGEYFENPKGGYYAKGTSVPLEVIMQSAKEYLNYIKESEPQFAENIDNVLNNFERSDDFVGYRNLIEFAIEQLKYNVNINDVEANEGDYEKTNHADNRNDTTDPENRMSGRVKRMLSQIPNIQIKEVRNEDGSVTELQYPVYTMLGDVASRDGNIVFTSLVEVLADVPINKMEDTLLELKTSGGNIGMLASQVIDVLNESTGKEKNEFFSVMRMTKKQYWLMKYSKTTSGELSYTKFSLMNSNQAAATDMLLSKWKSDFIFNNNKLIKSVLPSGELVIDTTVAEDIRTRWNEYTSAKGKKDIAGVTKFLREIGINVSGAAMVIYSKKLRKNYTSEYKKNNSGKITGIPKIENTDLLINNVNILFGELTKGNDIFKTDNVRLKGLAAYENIVNPMLTSNSFRNGNNDVVYGIVPSAFNSDEMHRLTGDKEHRDALLNIPFSKYSRILNEMNSIKLEEGKTLDDMFAIHYVDSLKNEKQKQTVINYEGASNFDKEVLHVNFSGANGFDYTLNLTLTPSDKTTFALVKSTRLGLHGISFVNGNIEISDDSKTLNQFMDYVLGEVGRVNQTKRAFHENKNTPENLIENYHYIKTDKGIIQGAGTKLFLFPELNNIIKELGDKKTESEYGDELDFEGNKEAIRDYIKGILVKMIETKVSKWKEMKFVEINNEGGIKSFAIDNNYFKKKDFKDVTGINKVNKIASDYLLNRMDYFINEYMMLTGDPAFFYAGKAKDVNSWEDILNATSDNLYKRTAKGGAPGIQGNTENKQDVRYLMINEPISFSEISKSELLDEDNKKAWADKLKLADAQEWCSFEEYLEHLLSFGEIDKTQYDNLMQNKNTLSNEQLKLILEKTIFGPLKPVYVNNQIDEKFNINVPYYIKTSVFPLIPQMLRGTGTELERVMYFMEKNKIDRLIPNTATKLGFRNSVKLYNDDGTFNDKLENIESNVVTLSREGLRIQQEVPFKEDKDHILEAGQLNTLAMMDMPVNMEVKMSNGKSIKANELRRAKDRITNEMYRRHWEELVDKLGFVKTPSGYVLKDMGQLKKMLIEEAINKGMPYNDILSLKTDDNGFVIPLMFSGVHTKIEQLMQSLVSNRVLKIKLPGKSFVQASTLGFSFNKNNVKTQSQIDSTNIVWIDGHEGKELDYKIDENGGVYAEVLLPSYFIKDGKQIQVTKEMLKNIDKDLLELVGYRIPNQGRSSTIKLKVVGFLPNIMGDLVVVPGGVTLQMGSDFDVDKLYVHRYNYKFSKDGMINKVQHILTDEERYKYYTKYLNFLNFVKSKKGYEFFKEEQDKYASNKLLSDIFGEDINERRGKLDFEKTYDENIEILENIVASKGLLSYEEFLKIPKIQTLTNEQLENQVIDIYLSILSSPELVNQILSPLDTKRIDDVISYLNSITPDEEKGNFVQNAVKEMGFINPDYQQTVVQNNAAGKIGVSAWSSIMTGHITFQQSGIYLKNVLQRVGDNYIIDVNKTVSVKFLKENGELYNDIIGDETNSVDKFDYKGHVKEGAFRLDKIRTFNGELISYTNKLIQSASVDNAKDLQLIKLNLNESTFNVAALISETGFGLDFIGAFLRQPIIVEYIKQLRNLDKITDSEFSKSKVKKFTEEFFKNYIGDEKFQELHNVTAFSLKDMHDMIGTDLDKRDDDYKKKQALILNNFLKYDKVAIEILGLRTSLNTDTQLLDKSIAASIEKKAKLEKNINRPTYLGNTENLIKATKKGGASQILSDSISLFTHNSLFPTNNLLLTRAFERLEVAMDKDGLSEKDVLQITYAFKSAVVGAISKNILNIDNIENERRRLLYGDNSLAYRIADYVNKNPDNLFLNSLILKLNGELYPSFIEFQSSKDVKEIFDYSNPIAWLELLNSNNPVEKEIGLDLVKYDLLFGDDRNAKDFNRFLPSDWKIDNKFGPEIKKLLSDIDNKEAHTVDFAERFVTQFFQHNPTKSKRIEDLSFAFDLQDINGEKTTLAKEIPNTFKVESKSDSDKLKSIWLENGNVISSYLYYFDKKSQSNVLYKWDSMDDDYVITFKRIGLLGGNLLTEYDLTRDNISTVIEPKNIIDTRLSKPTQQNPNKVEITKVETSLTDNKPKSVAEKYSFKDGPEAVLNTIINNGATQETKLLAKFLLDNLIHLNTIKSIEESKVIDDKYDNIEGKIVINTSTDSEYNTFRLMYGIDIRTAEGLERVILHELTHGLLFDKIKNKKGLSLKQQQAVDGLIDLFNNLKDNKELQAKIKDNTMASRAFDNVQEFVSVLFSNREFQELLNDTKTKGNKSILDKILQLFKNILGIDVKTDHALAAVLDEIIKLSDISTNNIKTIPLKTNFSRQSVSNDSEYIYLFTDNAKRTSGSFSIPDESRYSAIYGQGLKYPGMTQAVIRGLNNAFPITTMIDDKRTQWTDNRFNEYKEIIDSEIEIIKNNISNFKGIKFAAQMPFGKGQISNMKQTAPKIFEYMNKKLLEIGIDNSGEYPISIDLNANKTDIEGMDVDDDAFMNILNKPSFEEENIDDRDLGDSFKLQFAKIGDIGYDINGNKYEVISKNDKYGRSLEYRINDGPIKQINPLTVSYRFAASDENSRNATRELYLVNPKEKKLLSNENKKDNEFVFPDGIKVKTKFKLNSQQEEALNKMYEFYNDKDKQEFTLQGYAGTGKTSIIQLLVDYIDKKTYFKNIVFSSPTHRANAVLKQNLKDAKVYTLHKVFGLSPLMDLEHFSTKDIAFEKQKDAILSRGGLLIIDESSMINNELFRFIKDAAEDMGIKVLFMGDPAQIKPVGQTGLSKVFSSVKDTYELTKVERTGANPLLAEITNVRNSNNPEQMSMVSKQNDSGEGVTFSNDPKEIYDKAIELFESKEFKTNPLLVRVVSGTNLNVENTNKTIRKGIWKEKSSNEYNVGEILMGYDNFDVDYKTGEAKIINSGDYIVTNVSDLQKDGEIKYYEITIENLIDKDIKPVRIKVLSNENPKEVYNLIAERFEELRQFAIKQPKGSREAAQAWAALNAYKSKYASTKDMAYGTDKNGNPAVKIKKTLDYGYAHTIHKSQGGTYKNIVIDSRDISKFPDSELRKQLKYVALSRAQKHAYILTNNKITSDKKNAQEEVINNENTQNKVTEFKGQMSYSYGENKRNDIKSKTTLDAIKNGERTATTRYESQGNINYWKNAKVGDIITWYNGKGDSVRVRVTKPLYKLQGSGMNSEQWSRLEGWSVDYFNNKVKPKLSEAWQLQYEVISPVINNDENSWTVTNEQALLLSKDNKNISVQQFMSELTPKQRIALKRMIKSEDVIFSCK